VDAVNDAHHCQELFVVAGDFVEKSPGQSVSWPQPPGAEQDSERRGESDHQRLADGWHV